MEEQLTRFEEILADASSRITPEYFQLPVADADSVYRERVYCYELYHQMRSGWGEFGFSLGGEVDKNGHPHFEDGPYANAKPDFLVHQPGNMEHNLVCVEVKPLNRPAGFIADLRKLTWFCHGAAYHRGIFLVYGAAGVEASEALKTQLHDAAVAHAAYIDLECIHVFLHTGAMQRCGRINL